MRTEETSPNISDSGFIIPDSFNSGISASKPILIHESKNGWSRIYIIDRDGRFRVLKTLKSEYRGDTRYKSLMKKEFEIGYSLAHPNICEVYGHIDVKGLGQCIEMEWVNGDSLDKYLTKARNSRSLSLHIISQLCDAVGYCHSCQVVHRDIKPENIMITHNGNNVKLIDFGLSDSDSHSIFKTACGTSSYAAPELFNGSIPDFSSDIYSLGKVIALLHPSFSSIAAKCTRRNPSKRYPNVQSVKEAVESCKKRKIIKVSLFAVFDAAVLALTFAILLD